jgi:Protein of unknown function (DUF2582).
MLKSQIGTNAGTVWTLLSKKGKLTIREIGETLHCKESVLFLTLGWLLREDKIRIHDINGKLYFELKQPFMQTYY